MRIAVCLLVVVLAAVPASAAPFTWLVQGRITGVVDLGVGEPYDSAFVPGQPFAWWITMESAAPDFDPSDSCGLYFPIESMQFSTGGLSLATAGRPGQDYLLNPAGPGPCEVPVDNLARIRSNFGPLFFSMFFTGDFQTDALPVDASMIRALDRVDIFYAGFQFPVIARGTVDSITNVPEPAASLLVVGALLAWRRRRWHARRE